MWGYSFLSVTLINAAALTGVLVAPLMKTRHAKHALVFAIALAIGTLLSTAVLQLVPEVCSDAPSRAGTPRFCGSAGSGLSSGFWAVFCGPAESSALSAVGVVGGVRGCVIVQV